MHGPGPECGGGSKPAASPEFASLFAENGIESPEDFFRAGTVIRQRGGKQNVVLILSSAGGERRFFLKRHAGARSREGPLEMERTLQASALGIPTARVAAAGRSAEGSFFCSEEIPGGKPLDDWLAASPPSPGLRRGVIEQAARMAATLHGAGLFHRDLYLCHFFISPATDGGMPVLRLIDFQRLFRPRAFARRWMVKDLAEMNYSATAGIASSADRLRFLLTYASLRGMQADGAGFRKLLKDVHAKTRRIRAHDESRR